jgi:hypothetical protein
MDKDVALVPPERIERSILLIRGQKVMLDSDLAELYGVTTKRLNEQVRRNLSRFPEDFMFQLTESETQLLRSQFATSKEGRGGRRYPPYAFTPLESPAIYTGDDTDKGSIPYRKSGKTPSFLTG